MDAAVLLSCPKTGLKSIELEKLPPVSEASEEDLKFDKDILRRIAKKSRSLEALFIEKMEEINEPARLDLFKMLINII